MLKPGSLLAIGPKTNSRYRHAIPKLTQPVGPRISLSVRKITSYIEETGENEFEVTGKGEPHQCKNYPFIKSHDNKSEYTDEIRDQIDEYRRVARVELQGLVEEAKRVYAGEGEEMLPESDEE